VSIKSKQTLAYVGPFSFPNGGAAARRIIGIAKALQSLNFRVVVGSGQCNDEAPKDNRYDGVDVYSLNERTAEKYPTFIKHIFYFGMGKKTVAWLESLEQKPHAVILYSGYSPYLLRLIPWCRKNKIPLIFDAVEWYDPPSLVKGLLNPYYWNIELAMRFLIGKTNNVIAISKYLQNYYQFKACNTVRMPPTLDIGNIHANFEPSNSPFLTLGYTGNPGHKDSLDNVLSAILDLDENGKRIRLNIAGITEKQLLDFPALKNRSLVSLPDCLECLGVVSQVKALDIIRNADFSVLLRPNRRYAKAGFPTKFVESFSVGTPVIANFSSDLSEYLQDGENGIVCEDESSTSLILALNKALSLKYEQLKKMRVNAREMAAESFDISSKRDSLINFLGQLDN